MALSPITFDGLASGLNTTDIIIKLMEIERRPLVLLQKKEDQLKAKQDAWRQIRTSLASLQSKLADLKLQSTFLAKAATSSNEQVVKVSAGVTAAPGTYSIKVKSLATATRIWSEPVSGGLAKGSLTITVNNTTSTVSTSTVVTVNAGDTLQTLASNINKANAGVTASVIDQRLVLEANTLGSGISITTSVSDGDPTDNVDLTKQLTFPTTNASTGQNALFWVNGIEVTRTSNSISDVIPGVTIELTGTSKKTGTSGTWDDYESTTVTVAADTQKVVDAVKAFVDQYNAAWNAIKEKMSYNATTKEAGVLFGDGGLQAVKAQLRNLVTSEVVSATGKWHSLASIGISTGAIGSGVSAAEGTLTVDETKLKNALLEDPSAVESLFDSANGVAVRLDSYLQKVTTSDTTGLITSRENSLDAQIKDLQDQIDRMNERLALREENLRRQFTQLEVMLSQAQAQGAWLAGQLKTLGS